MKSVSSKLVETNVVAVTGCSFVIIHSFSHSFIYALAHSVSPSLAHSYIFFH